MVETNVPLTPGICLLNYKLAKQLPIIDLRRPKLLDKNFGLFFEKIHELLERGNMTYANELLIQGYELFEGEHRKSVAKKGLEFIDPLVMKGNIDAALVWVRFFNKEFPEKKDNEQLLEISRQIMDRLLASGNLNGLHKWIVRPHLKCRIQVSKLAKEQISSALQSTYMLERFFCAGAATARQGNEILEYTHNLIHEYNPQYGRKIVRIAVDNLPKIAAAGLDKSVERWGKIARKEYTSFETSLDGIQHKLDEARGILSNVKKLRRKNFEAIDKMLLGENYKEAHGALIDAWRGAGKNKTKRKAVLLKAASILPEIGSQFDIRAALFWVRFFNRELKEPQYQKVLVHASQTLIERLAGSGRLDDLHKWMSRHRTKTHRKDFITLEERSTARSGIGLSQRFLCSQRFGQLHDVLRSSHNILRHCPQRSTLAARQGALYCDQFIKEGYLDLVRYWAGKAAAVVDQPDLQEKAMRINQNAGSILGLIKEAQAGEFKMVDFPQIPDCSKIGKGTELA